MKSMEMEQEKIKEHYKRYQQRKSQIVVNNEKIRGITIRKIVRPILRIVLKIMRMIEGQSIEIISSEIPKSDGMAKADLLNQKWQSNVWYS